MKKRTDVVVGAAVLAGIVVVGGTTCQAATDAAREAVLGADSILTVRGLVVVDQNGVQRARLGAPLPDPIIRGESQPRTGPISGLLIFDADGDERGGYATADESSEAFLTLDAKDSQVALFLANPEDGANLQLWDLKGNRVGMWAVGGSPNFLMAREGKTIFRLPEPDTISAP